MSQLMLKRKFPQATLQFDFYQDTVSYYIQYDYESYDASIRCKLQRAGNEAEEHILVAFRVNSGPTFQLHWSTSDIEVDLDACGIDARDVDAVMRTIRNIQKDTVPE